MIDFKELIRPEILSQLPFLSLTTDGKVRANKTRLIEMGIFLGAVYVIISQLRADVAEIKPVIKQIPVLQTQVDALDKRQMRVEDYLLDLQKTRRK